MSKTDMTELIKKKNNKSLAERAMPVFGDRNDTSESNSMDANEIANEIASENASYYASINTNINNIDQAKENTGINTSKNGSLNTSEHASINTSELNNDKAPLNTSENADINASVNTGEKATVTRDNSHYKKRRKPKFDDCHRKHTVWIENQIAAALDEIIAGERGEKTRIINEALIEYMKKNHKSVWNEYKKDSYYK